MGPLRNSRRTSVLLDMGIGFDALRTVIDTSPRRRRPCLLCSGYPPMGICPWRPQDLPGMTGRFDQPMHGSLEASPWRGLQWKGLQRGGFDTDRAGRGFVSIAAQFFGADHRQRDGCIPATSWAALGHAIAIPGHAGGFVAVDLGILLTASWACRRCAGTPPGRAGMRRSSRQTPTGAPPIC